MTARALTIARRAALVAAAGGTAAWIALGVLLIVVRGLGATWDEGVAVLGEGDAAPATLGKVLLAAALLGYGLAVVLAVVGLAPSAWRWVRHDFVPWITARSS